MIEYNSNLYLWIWEQTELSLIGFAFLLKILTIESDCSVEWPWTSWFIKARLQMRPFSDSDKTSSVQRRRFSSGFKVNLSSTYSMVLTDEEKEKKESFGCFEIQESERMNVVVQKNVHKTNLFLFHCYQFSHRLRNNWIVMIAWLPQNIQNYMLDYIFFLFQYC
jgi:hypothetical protein